MQFFVWVVPMVPNRRVQILKVLPRKGLDFCKLACSLRRLLGGSVDLHENQSLKVVFRVGVRRAAVAAPGGIR